MSTTHIIKRILEALNIKAQKDLAAFFDTSPSTISSAIGRDQIPEGWLYKVAYETQCRVEWLKTGDLPKYLDEAVAEARATYGAKTLEGMDTLLHEWQSLDEPKRRLAELSLKAIALGEDTDMIQAVVTTTLKKHEHDKGEGSKKPPKKKRNTP